MTQMTNPQLGEHVLDPAAGTGGFLSAAIDYIREKEVHTLDDEALLQKTITGWELKPVSYVLGLTNLILHGIDVPDWHYLDSLKTEYNSIGPKQQVNVILANPPFNLKDWRGPTELTDDPRWSGYEVPPVSNANYGWILHMISKLSANGVAGFLLANGALGDPDTKNIRKKIIENNLIEAIIVLPRDMFYSTDISVTLWILNKNKKYRQGSQNGVSVQYRDRSEEILFIDLRRLGIEFEKKYTQLTDDEIKRVVTTYHGWQREDLFADYQDIPEFCFSASN
jgi:type I restriction enzyme M protein